MSRHTDIVALESFVSANSDLEELERLVSPFNIFEVLGATWHELRHSRFLAFMLDPRGSHGLGDAFLRRFLLHTLKQVEPDARPISLVDIDVADFAEVEVRREWRSIDILVLIPSLRLAVVIENKIYSSEHDDQLARYMAEVENSRLGPLRAGIYLTPAGDAPSDDRYLPQNYAVVADLTADLLVSFSGRIGPDVETMLRHYVAVLRRHVVEDSEVAALARKIYQKHGRAIDLIVEHRPDRQEAVGAMLRTLVSERADLELESSSKKWIRFTFRPWHSVPARGSGWIESNRMLVFEMENAPDRMFLKLIIGPGDLEIRQRLFEAASQNQPFFRPSRKVLTTTWQVIWRREFLSRAQLDEELETVHDLLQGQWTEFIQLDLPGIAQRLEPVVRSLSEPPIPDPTVREV